jgi:hypothetical protein
VNDTWGHAAGDAVLRRLAVLLAASSRAGDLVFRYGGEEFAVILPATGLDLATEVAERIRAAVASATFEWEEWIIPISVSVGVAAQNASMDAAADAGTALSNPCCGTMTCAASGGAPGSYCICRGSGETCASNFDCCPGTLCTSGRCAASTTTCFGPGDMRACTGDTQCCGGLRCARLLGNQRCCTGPGSACRSSIDCCGAMLCVAGRCACRNRDQSCEQDIDCCAGRCVSNRCVAP